MRIEKHELWTRFSYQLHGIHGALNVQEVMSQRKHNTIVRKKGRQAVRRCAVPAGLNHPATGPTM